MDNDPFHRGEHEAQRRAGVRLRGAPIRDQMSDQHRSFFAGLPVVFAGVADREGAPVATVLTGPPGFLSSSAPRTLRIDALPHLDDPAAAGVRTGAPAGLLGIDLGTRRRNRLNGTILATDEQGFTVGVQQSFGNCPQYIQARVVEERPALDRIPVTERLGGLDAAARALIGAADTFFVASSGGDTAGLDLSHRGGRPGFVQVEGDVLTIPDFRGNRYFNTLGNLLLDPRVGLLFVEFDTGSVLHLQGRADIDWDGGPVSGLEGAERLWRVRVTAGWRRSHAVPLRWAFRDERH